MRWLEGFGENLKERYCRLYGEKDYKQRVEKEQHDLLLKCTAAIVCMCMILGAGLMSNTGNNRNLLLNQHGEIVGIKRPSAEQGTVSFNTKVVIDEGKKQTEKEYCITIEPAGEEKEQQISVLPEKTKEQETDDELRLLISRLNMDLTEKKVTLPQELKSGEKLIWKQSETSNLPLYFILILIMLAAVYKSRFQKIQKEEKKARESIIKELPEFINKIVLLMNAGIVLNTAFMKIMEDSEKNRKSKSYFYIQLEQIYRSIRETNSSLHLELREFAKRSGVKELMRVSNIICDNISKGADLSDKLRQENELLWIARKQQSEEKGRLAETKLTLPLMILLLVLIMVTIAPALMGI